MLTSGWLCAVIKHHALVVIITRRVMGMQLLTKAGLLNVPQWYESGRVWQEQNPNFPYRECLRV